MLDVTSVSSRDAGEEHVLTSRMKGIDENYFRLFDFCRHLFNSQCSELSFVGIGEFNF